jgi:hypothetical protein
MSVKVQLSSDIQIFEGFIENIDLTSRSNRKRALVKPYRIGDSVVGTTNHVSTRLERLIYRCISYDMNDIHIDPPLR